MVLTKSPDRERDTMGLIRWMKTKFGDLERRADAWVDRTAPQRERKAAELKREIESLKQKLDRPRTKR
jgi:hypothetical protein